MSGVSILVPTVRVENIPQLRAWCFERSGLPARDIEFLFQVDEARRGLPRTLQQLIQASKNDLFIFLGDDCEPLQNFLRDALDSLQDGWGLVVLNDTRNCSAHFLAHKRLLDFLPDGQFFHDSYHHAFCHNELEIRAFLLHRVRYVDAPVLIHHDQLTRLPRDQWDEPTTAAYKHWNDDHENLMSRINKDIMPLVRAFLLDTPCTEWDDVLRYLQRRMKQGMTVEAAPPSLGDVLSKKMQ